MSNSVRPHRLQPTRLPRPWDSPGKNTGVGCHFLLQCMQVKSESEVARSCLTLSDPTDCSLPGSSTHGILQARVLEWGCHCLLQPSLLVQHKYLFRAPAGLHQAPVVVPVPGARLSELNGPVHCHPHPHLHCSIWGFMCVCVGSN